MGLESFFIDKAIGIGYFISAAFFFLTGIAASYVNIIITSVFLILAAICIGASIWYIRKE
jgi:hypothetical protein